MVDEQLRTLLRDTTRIVFVCSGNMVRSAFADLYARHIGIRRDIASIATTYRNDALYPETATALRQRGIDSGWIQSFRPRHVDDVPELFEAPASTLLFGMTHSHLQALAASPAAECPRFLISRLLQRENGSEEIADPVMDGADFATTFHTLERCVDALERELGA